MAEINTNLDTTPLPPNNFVAQDPQSAELAGYVRTKTFGRDVRESIARSIELNSTRSKNAEELANETLAVTNRIKEDTTTATSNMANQVELIRAEKDAVIANATVDSEVILARGGKATLGQRLDETTAQLADNAISPENYNGNDLQKISQAIQDAINQDRAVKFAKQYDITGLGPIVINKPGTNRRLLYLFGQGGGITKRDSGYIFTAVDTDHGDIISNEMHYYSTEDAGTTVWDCNKLIRLSSISDYYGSCDKIFEADNRWFQSVRMVTCTVISGKGYAVSARHMFDCSFVENTIEHREGFIRNSYNIPSVFGQDNLNIRINNNVIEGLTGKAIYLGACRGSSIKGNYFEYNEGGYIDLSANTNVVSHGGLEVSNNMIAVTDEQKTDNTPAITWGFLGWDATSIGNSTSGLLHSIGETGSGNVLSIGERYGTLTDNVQRVSQLKGIDKARHTVTTLANGKVRKLGDLVMATSTVVKTSSIPVSGEIVVNVPMPQEIIAPAQVTFQVTGQWEEHTWEIVNWQYVEGFTSVSVKIRNLHTMASYFNIYVVATYFSS